MAKNDKTICVYGHHELDYPRNRTIQNVILEAGWDIELCHSRASFPWRHFILLGKFLKCVQKVQVVYVTEGGHRLVPLLKIFCLLFNKKIIFDPFISRYNTRIEDRKMYSKNGMQALICKWQDWSSCHAADFLVFDTIEHKDYFYSRYRLSKSFAVVPVAVDEDVFVQKQKTVNKESRTVLFYGTYIPLHGIQYILRAIETLKKEEISFTLIGSGQVYDEMQLMSQDLDLKFVRFLPTVSTEILAREIEAAALCLGIFDDGIKASNVVPNKVVQCAAMGKAVITRDSEAVKRYFTHKENVYLVPPADSNALASAIQELLNIDSLRETLGVNAQKVFSDSFSHKSLVVTIKAVLEKF